MQQLTKCCFCNNTATYMQRTIVRTYQYKIVPQTFYDAYRLESDLEEWKPDYDDSTETWLGDHEPVGDDQYLCDEHAYSEE